MKHPQPPGTIQISESRIYYLLCQMRKRELVADDRATYAALRTAWAKFMADPNQYALFYLPNHLLEPLRHLEMLLHQGPDEGARHLHMGIEAAGRGMQQPIADSVRRCKRGDERKPHGYWAERLFEIEKKYTAGVKVGDLKTEYSTSSHQIFACIYRARAKLKYANPSTDPSAGQIFPAN